MLIRMRVLAACHVILILLGIATAPVLATPLNSETFSYANGDLTTTSGGVWTAHSGSGSNPVQSTSGQAVLVQESGSREDVNRLTGQTLVSGGKWYAGFDAVVTGGDNTVYFAHFKTTSITTFASRVFVTSHSGGDFTFGLSDSSSLDATWASALSFGTTYRVVHSYDFDSKVARLWVDPVNEASTKITATAGLTSRALVAYAFRQDIGDSQQTIDNLLVGTTFEDAVPEPASMVLALFGLLGTLMTGRRQRSIARRHL